MRALLPMVLALLLCRAEHAAPPPPRPYSGCGVLTLQLAPGAEPPPIAVYAEPGLQRIALLEIAALPRLSGENEEPRLAVGASRGGWLRLAFDDAGREGWIKPPRSWEYLPWAEFLPGRWVRVLPGMKQGLYALKGEPGDQGGDRGALSRDQEVRVLQVEEDWARLQAPAGWFRWRDGDGRLTVSLPAP